MKDSYSQEIVWMLAVRDGQLNKLAPIFERYKDPLYNFFLRSTGDPSTSEDLVQEVFLRIMKYRKTYKGDGSFKGWIFNMARNVAMDHFRSQKRTQKRADDAVEWQTEYYDAVSQEKIESNEKWLRTQRAISELKPDYQQVILLSRFHGLKHSEIAKMLGCTPGAVKLKIYRAMLSLKKTILDSSTDTSVATTIHSK